MKKFLFGALLLLVITSSVLAEETLPLKSDVTVIEDVCDTRPLKTEISSITFISGDIATTYGYEPAILTPDADVEISLKGSSRLLVDGVWYWPRVLIMKRLTVQPECRVTIRSTGES